MDKDALPVGGLRVLRPNLGPGASLDIGFRNERSLCPQFRPVAVLQRRLEAQTIPKDSRANLVVRDHLDELESRS
jgi:hypothetical protein